MPRMRRILGQWGRQSPLVVVLLGTVLLALAARPGASLLALLARFAPANTLPAGVETYHGQQVYDVGQVLGGVCQQPDLWAGRTILVRGDEIQVSADQTALDNVPAASYFSSCTGPTSGASDTWLYEYGNPLATLCSPRFPCDVEDPRTDPLNPAYQAHGSTAGPLLRIYRTTLIVRADCGMGSCVFGEGARLVSRS